MRFAVCIEQTVSRLNVSVQNAVLMRVMHSARQLRDHFCSTARRRWFMPGNCIELTATDQSHAEVTRTVALADFVNWNNARMVQPRCGFRFQAKTLEMRFACPLPKANHFQCDYAVKTFLPRSER